jgi:anthranilate phosphoribosyltransferase
VLDEAEVRAAAAALLTEAFPDEDKADFLQALHARGETPDEVCAFAAAFLERAQPFPVEPQLGPVLDVCGTGGDKLGLFNISTAVMFVAAGAGARLVKHGNRGITSRSGGADVLEALGVPVDLPVALLQAMLEDAGAAFLFAPRFHPAFKSVAPARKLLAGRGSASVFNMLGPLLNPARPPRQLTGVFSERLLPVYAAVLPGLGRERAWVVHGRAGEGAVMDEISTLGPTTIVEIDRGAVTERSVESAQLGVSPARVEDLRGGDAGDNARLLLGILEGDERGARRDIVMVNTAAALVVAGAAGDWDEAVARADESLDSGAARRVLNKMRSIAAKA